MATVGADDHFISVTGNDVHVIARDQRDRQLPLVRTAGAWRADDLAIASDAPSASGGAAAFLHANALHLVSRAGTDGHLIDQHRTGGVATHDDLTATAHDSNGHSPPCATYRPATFVRAGEAPRIVFRAVRGGIWLIERDTLVARNLGAVAEKVGAAGIVGAPNAAGNPTAVAADTPRVFYRAVDGTVIEIFNEGATVKWREVCAGAAGDPAAFADAEGPKVSFRAEDGSIRVARLVNGTWTCEQATMTRSPELPVDPATLSGPSFPA